jgi:hypothetical protein
MGFAGPLNKNAAQWDSLYCCNDGGGAMGFAGLLKYLWRGDGIRRPAEQMVAW